MRISIRHQLSVTPPPGTANAVLQLLLTPQSGPAQKVESWAVETAGIDNAGRFADAFGNAAHLVNQIKPEGAIVVTVTGVVQTTDKHGVLGWLAGEPVPALYKRVTSLAKAPAGLPARFRGGKNRLDTLHGLMGWVGEVLGTAEEKQVQTQMAADGSQRQSQAAARALPPPGDYAHAFIGACRALEIPARYVTGYLARAEAGQAAFHAWAEAHDERLGWIGFDPRLQLCPTDRHVRLAVGLDALGARPVRMVPADEVSELDVTVEAA
jgi:hypothetical protein